ncbi:MAG: Zn-dependent hydrolase, partial [Cyclobacteriaceae bacterium]
MRHSYLLLGIALILSFCSQPKKETTETVSPIAGKLDDYKKVKLTTDLSQLSEKEKAMIPKLIEAADIMNGLFWYEAYGDKDALLAGVEDPAMIDYLNINYGPWDRLDDNKPFLEGVGAKPEGANFYPADMTKEEYEKADLSGKDSFYTFLRR